MYLAFHTTLPVSPFRDRNAVLSWISSNSYEFFTGAWARFSLFLERVFGLPPPVLGDDVVLVLGDTRSKVRLITSFLESKNPRPRRFAGSCVGLACRAV